MNYFGIEYTIGSGDRSSILFKTEHGLLDDDQSDEITEQIKEALRSKGITELDEFSAAVVDELIFTELESFWDENLQGMTCEVWDQYVASYMDATRQNDIIEGKDYIIFVSVPNGREEGEVYLVKALFDDGNLFYKGSATGVGIIVSRFFAPTEVYHWYPWSNMFVLNQVNHIHEQNKAPTVDEVINRFQEINGIDMNQVFRFVMSSIASGDLKIVRYNKYLVDGGLVGLIREGMLYQGESYLRGLFMRHGFDNSYITDLKPHGFVEVLEPSHNTLSSLYVYGSLKEREALYAQTQAEEAAGKIPETSFEEISETPEDLKE